MTLSLKRNSRALLAWCAATVVFAVGIGTASAVQIVEGGDGSTIYAKLSKKEMTRLAVDHGRIASFRVREGELGIEPDEETGQVFLTVPAAAAKPINGFLTTDSGTTYSLVLQIVDAPADSIIVKQPKRLSPSRNDFKTTSYDKAVKRLVTLMANDEIPDDVQVKQPNRKLDLWKEASMTLETQYFIGDLVGERYSVANVSQSSMVLDEREFYRKGVSVIALDQLNLAPGASTRLYVIREKAQNE
jgi:conjugal transfer pilus assembly protein TraK